MKTSLKSLMTVIMALAMFSCYAQANKNLDANGYFNVVNAPQTHSKYRTQSTMNEDGSYTTKIYKGKKLLQTLKHETTSGEVRFIDMNFDGEVDLFVGPPAARNYSTIYLYNKKKGNFVPAKVYPTQENGSTFNGYILVNDKKKHFVTMSSDGAFSTYYQLYTWKGYKLVPSEGLMVFTDPNEYTNYGVETKYTLYYGPLDFYYSPEGVGRKCIRTNKLKDLPKEWQKIIESFND